MTDETTNSNTDNHDFGLNHFDTAPGYEKQEPIIPKNDEPEADASQAAPDPQHSTAPAPDSPSSAPPTGQRSGTKSITVFAILAMLVAAIAVWLNPGAHGDSDESTALPSRPVLTADVQVQRLETRLASLEQRSRQQNEMLHQQVAQLQQQLASLTGQLSKQTAKQTRPQQSIRPAVRQKNRPARRPSTAAATPMQKTGWVVNLASVESRHAASKALSRYKARAIPAEIHATVIKGKTWYRLRIGGFASRQQAIAQKRHLAQKYGIKDAWVQKP